MNEQNEELETTFEVLTLLQLLYPDSAFYDNEDEDEQEMIDQLKEAQENQRKLLYLDEENPLDKFTQAHTKKEEVTDGAEEKQREDD